MRARLLIAVSMLAIAACSQTQKASQPQAEDSAESAYLPDSNRKYPERVLWGDEHVHSAWSADAALSGATLGPEDAVRFARGEGITNNRGDKVKLRAPRSIGSR